MGMKKFLNTSRPKTRLALLLIFYISNLLNNGSASKNIFRQSTSWKVFFPGFLRSDLQCKKNTFRTSEKKNKLENTTKSIFCSKDL